MWWFPPPSVVHVRACAVAMACETTRVDAEPRRHERARDEDVADQPRLLVRGAGFAGGERQRRLDVGWEAGEGRGDAAVVPDGAGLAGRVEQRVEFVGVVDRAAVARGRPEPECCVEDGTV